MKKIDVMKTNQNKGDWKVKFDNFMIGWVIEKHRDSILRYVEENILAAQSTPTDEEIEAMAEKQYPDRFNLNSQKEAYIKGAKAVLQYKSVAAQSTPVTKDVEKIASNIALKFAEKFQDNYPDKEHLWVLMDELKDVIVSSYKAAQSTEAAWKEKYEQEKFSKESAMDYIEGQKRDIKCLIAANELADKMAAQSTEAAELELSEKAHDITIEQLMRTQEERNKWKDLSKRLLEEMDNAEWYSPIQREATEMLNFSTPPESAPVKAEAEEDELWKQVAKRIPLNINELKKQFIIKRRQQ